MSRLIWDPGKAAREVAEMLSRSNDLVRASAAAATAADSVTRDLGATFAGPSARLLELQESLQRLQVSPSFDKLQRSFPTMQARQFETLQRSFETPLESVAEIRLKLEAAMAHRVFSTPRFEEAFSRLDVSAEVVIDAEAGYEEVLRPTLGSDAPDGIAAIPLVLDQLSPSRRRDLLIAVALLLATTVLYARALAADADAVPPTIYALLATAGLYVAVINAIDEAEDAFAGDEPDPG
jgi:hypothetical protein